MKKKVTALFGDWKTAPRSHGEARGTQPGI